MSKRAVPWILLFIGILPAWGFAFEDRGSRVDSLFAAWDRDESPGCALGVLRDGDFVYRNAYGMANLEHGIPLTSTSVFRMGSVSKQFAAFALLLAEEQGKLSLDDDVRRFVPEVPEAFEGITLRHLVHHTSGLRDYLELMELAGKRDEDFYTEEEILQALSRQEKLNFEPGSEYLYSNLGYFLISQIIQRATGASLKEFSEEHLFELLGMENTHFHDDFRHVVKGRADGYRRREGDGAYEIHMTRLEMVGDGGLFTTIDDLLKWDQNFYTGEVGGEELAAKRRVPGRLTDGTVQDYGAGLRLGTYRGLRTVSHGGSFVGYRASMLQFPDERFSVYIACNVASARPSELALRVADIFLEGELGPMPEGGVGLEPGLLDRWAGLYWSDDTAEIAEIRVEDGTLLWVEEERRLRPVSERRFEWLDEGVASTVTFEEESGERVMVVRSPGQRPFRFGTVDPVVPDIVTRASYVGLYRCRELDVTYRVELDEEGGLSLVLPFSRSPLSPAFRDAFRWRSGSLVFDRDDNGKVLGFELASGRARNFFFERW